MDQESSNLTRKTYIRMYIYTHIEVDSTPEDFAKFCNFPLIRKYIYNIHIYIFI